MVKVDIKQGSYRGMPFSGIYDLVKAYQEGAKGGFVTIRNPNPQLGHPPVQRISLTRDDFTLLGSDGELLPDHIQVADGAVPSMGGVKSSYETAFMQTETDEEATVRIRDTFLMLDRITDAAAAGIVRGVVVSGSPGIGKSFGVEKQLDVANMFRTLEGKDPMYEIVTGGVSPIGLYQKLYHNRAPKQVLLFDDCDVDVLFDEECLMLLKGALNSGERRRISWNKESRTLLTADIPDSFDFDGSVIFLSNVDFEAMIHKDSRIATHLGAIMSRCHYLDLEISTLRDKMLRVKQLVNDGMLEKYDFTQDQIDELVAYVGSNAEYMREVSPRAVKKMADLIKANPGDWVTFVEATLLTREAKFKRLAEKRAEEAAKRGVILHS